MTREDVMKLFVGYDAIDGLDEAFTQTYNQAIDDAIGNIKDSWPFGIRGHEDLVELITNKLQSLKKQQ